MPRVAVLSASLLAGLLLAWAAVRTPTPLGSDAPAGAFSAERAFDDVIAIARAPHPTGSAENARVRDYLVARLRGLGFAPRVQHAPARGATPALDNIVAVLPGRSRTAPAVLIMSHYDSVPDSPGAADDAAGVAAMLEVARALRTGPAPARDVVFLFTDGEELGLLGARAFFAEHPLAERAGVVLNLEARGGGGRAYMFETGRGNGETVALFGRAAPRPSANSLAVFVYERMPNATDFTIAKDRDLPGLNFAFVGRPGQYHHASSTPEALDRGSLQHIGDQALAAGCALAFAEALPGRAPDLVYSDVLGLALVAYPAWAGWAVLGAALALGGAAALRAAGHGQASVGEAGRALLGGLHLLFLGAVLLRLMGQLARPALGTEAERRLLEAFGAYEALAGAIVLATSLFVVGRLARGGGRRAPAVLAVAAGLACSSTGVDAFGLALGLAAAGFAVAAFGAPVRRWSLWLGLIALGLALTAALQLAAPTTAFIAAWPTLLAAGTASAAALSGSADLADARARAIAGGAAALVLGQVGAWGHGVFLAVGSWLPEALALFTLLGVIAAAPLLATARASAG